MRRLLSLSLGVSSLLMLAACGNPAANYGPSAESLAPSTAEREQAAQADAAREANEAERAERLRERADELDERAQEE